MILRLGFVLFVVGTALCGTDFDSSALQNVFGPAGATPAQAVPVTPVETLTDPDYWDNDELPHATITQFDVFDWTLTRLVSETSNSNMLLSPLGLKLALGILAEAATGPTRDEIMFVLDVEANRTSYRKKFAAIVESLQKPSNYYVLNLGSKIYVENNVSPRQMYAAIAQQIYKTDITPIDFNNPPVAAKVINDWVFNVTEGRINNLVSADNIADTVVMILSTLFFKGTWRHQFLPNATKEGRFQVSPQATKPVQFMNVVDKFYYTNSAKLDSHIVRLPYQGNKFSMYIVVPNSITGVKYAERNLLSLRTEIQNMTEHLVYIDLPKWNFKYSSHLHGVLKSLGIRNAFQDTASFPGIARGQAVTRPLKVSKILQRNGIEVNELGSVAYSITEIALVNKFGEDDGPAVMVKADKPFLFFIRDETTGQLLFSGKVVDPSKEEGEYNYESGV